MSKRMWWMAALVGACLAVCAVIGLAIGGWKHLEARTASDVSSGMIFLGLGMIGVAGLITNPLPTAAKPQPAAEPSSYS